jgi:hypothetical protein
MYFDDRRLELDIPTRDAEGNPAKVAFLVDHLVSTQMRDERTEFFVVDGHM